MGIWTIQSSIFPENIASAALHRAAGFRVAASGSGSASTTDTGATPPSSNGAAPSSDHAIHLIRKGVSPMGEPAELETVRDRVRARYAQAATAVTGGGTATCGPACAPQDPDGTGAGLYSGGEQGELPGQAVAASLGCGNPVAVAGLRDGETVLDLGSGGGIDVLLSARRVGPAGKAYGLDMTTEMLDLARANAAAAGAANVEFLQGHIEAIPLPAAAVDVIISNCVIHLSGYKAAVLAESFRVLRPGGRFGVSDIVAEDHLTEAERAERGRDVGCIAGTLTFAGYRGGLTRAGFTAITITVTHQVADGLHSAIIQATKPAAAR